MYKNHRLDSQQMGDRNTGVVNECVGNYSDLL